MEERSMCDVKEMHQENVGVSCSRDESGEMWHGLYGAWIDKNHCVGYCKFHKGYMTFKQIKKKECLQKQCSALERLPHQFWKQREIKKQNKKEKKNI